MVLNCIAAITSQQATRSAETSKLSPRLMDMKIPGHLDPALATKDMKATVSTLKSAVSLLGAMPSIACVPMEMDGMAAMLKLGERGSVKTLEKVKEKCLTIRVSHKVKN